MAVQQRSSDPSSGAVNAPSRRNLLYTSPEEKIPILYLTGERSSGKTTFLRYLQYLFVDEMIIDKPSRLSQTRYNSNWEGKKIIAFDEALILEELSIEQLRYYARADRIVLEARGEDPRQIDFGARFIVTANDGALQ